MDCRPVGFFDSGLGGISVLRAALRELPKEDYIYYGDTANIPYGDKPREQVLALSDRITDFLLKKNCKAIVIACNTATSVAAEMLREKHNFPIIGLEPALKPAALLPGEGKIAVLATKMTLSLPKFRLLMEKYGQDAIPIPCSGLMECVEAGNPNGEEARRLLEKYLEPVKTQSIKAVVLGCTHYPFLKKTISSFFPPEVPLLDGSGGAARQLRRRLTEMDLHSDCGTGQVTFYSSRPGGEEKMKSLLALSETLL